MNFETVIYEKIDQVARITLNRPQVHNAQNDKLIRELDRAVDLAAQDREVKVVILTGAGKSFSSGHDLKLYSQEEGGLVRASNTEGRWDYESEAYFDKCLKIWDLDKPTIAQVSGHCVAAGFMLANMCDLIVASEDAIFCDPVLRMGGAGAEVLIHPWVLGIRKASEILFTGDPLTATDALQAGMINRVVPLEELAETTMELARRIALMPDYALKFTKRSLRSTMDIMGLRNALKAHLTFHVMQHSTEEQTQLLDPEKRKNVKEFIKNRDNKF